MCPTVPDGQFFDDIRKKKYYYKYHTDMTCTNNIMYVCEFDSIYSHTKFIYSHFKLIIFIIEVSRLLLHDIKRAKKGLKKDEISQNKHIS